MCEKMTQASGPFFRVLKQAMEIQQTTANPKDPPVNWILQYPETCGSMEIPLSLASPPRSRPKESHLCKSQDSGSH